jgi:proteasome lid subunit RPN8/RPN11
MIIPGDLLRAMLDHVRAHYPEEACGLVAGRDGRATAVYPIDNIHRSPVLYEMDPLQQIRAMIDLEAAGDDLLAIFHSHPAGPARPSPTDVAQAHYPDALQVIISLADLAQPSVRAFTIVDGRVTEVEWLAG